MHLWNSGTVDCEHMNTSRLDIWTHHHSTHEHILKNNEYWTFPMSTLFSMSIRKFVQCILNKLMNRIHLIAYLSGQTDRKVDHHEPKMLNQKPNEVVISLIKLKWLQYIETSTRWPKIILCLSSGQCIAHLQSWWNHTLIVHIYMGMHWTICILLWIRCATAAIGSHSKHLLSRNYGFVLMIFHYNLNIFPENYLISSECIWEIARMNGLLHLLHIWVNGYIKYLQFKTFHFLIFF